MSITGLAASPGTAVLPTCSIEIGSSVENGSDTRTQHLEQLRPARIVILDDDWIRQLSPLLSGMMSVIAMFRQLANGRLLAG